MDHSKKPVNENPGKKAGILSRLFILWIVPLLWRGHRPDGLTVDDLCKCIDGDISEDLGDSLQREWDRELETSRRKRRPPKLRTALLKTFYRPSMVDALLVFLFIVIKSFSPLVLSQLLIQFQQPSTQVASFAHPAAAVADNSSLPWTANNTNGTWSDEDNSILNRTKRELGGSGSDNDLVDEIRSPDNGISVESPGGLPFWEHAWNDVYWLSAGVVVLAAIGCFLMHHADLRQRMLGAQMRIACCSLMYRKTLKLSKRVAGQTPTGYLVNLLSNDVARFDVILILVHYAWLLPFQSVLICYLIYRKIGLAAVAGVVSLLLQTVPVQTRLSRLSAKLRMKVAHRTDKRVSIMNELIQGIQVIKMYAWEIPFQKIVAEARRLEIKQIRYASYIRAVYFSTMIYTERLTLFVTLLACVLLNKPITADIVFSSAQYFNILQLTAAIFYPLAVSLVAEGLVSIQRVEQYLLQEEQGDNGSKFLCNAEAKEAAEHAISIKDVTATWETEEKKPKTLDGIRVQVKTGQLCAIIGQVGAGKSSILHLLLGEMPIESGSVEVNGSTSYGSQEPWLFPGTIRSNILFGQDFDRKLYHEVVSCCALTTDFVQLPDGDKTIVGERGAALSGGQKARISLARSVYKRASTYLLDDPLSAVDAHVGKHLFDEVIGPQGYLARQGKTRILVTHQVHFLKDADWIVILDKGRIMYQGTYNNIANSNMDLAKMVGSGGVAEEKQPLNEVDNTPLTDDEDGEDIPFIDGYVGPRSPSLSNRSTNTEASENDDDVQGHEEEKADGNISLRVWLQYFRAGGSIFFLLFLASLLLFSQVITSGSDYFVNFWTQQEFLRSVGEKDALSTEACLYIYGAFIVAVILMTIVRGWMFFNLCMRASKTLHNRMFASLMQTTMRFFDINPSGRILNRFSRDMGAIDELLPKAIMDSVQILLVMVGILVMVSVANPILLAALLVAVVAFGLVLRLYLRPAQDLKRLEGICRSPVFSHMSSSLSGLSTIRANNAQNRIVVEFDNLQDVHSSVWRLNVASNTALGVWLDCISTAFVAAVTFSFIALHQKTFSGNVGLAISQALILTGMVQYGVRMCCESIQHMTSVERVLQYIDVAPEADPKAKPRPKWPESGRIEFSNMFLKYDVTAAPVLKNLNLQIEPGWKVGVVGRTGAGKSSLISALFRLSPIEGKILIDGIDTATIELESLRKSISIIPQDPVLFSATLRYNLDPFNLFDDTDLYKVLEEVELKGITEGLDFLVTESGGNFSVGQRQLICLARAILRNSKILVLDEATANVDPTTDSLIQKTIREKFKSCTVLTVAHRLHTVMDSDRILVMDAGYAKEFGIPHTLLSDSQGMLRSIVDATGHQESESLKRIAEGKFKQLQAESEM